MKLTIEQAIETVHDAITNNTVHADYVKTVEYAGRMARWNTGTGIEEDLRRFLPRENTEAFQQRVNLTGTLTKSLIGSVMKPHKTVLTSNRVVRRIKPVTRGDVASVDQVQDKFDRFYGSDDYDGGLDYWMKTRFFELTRMDPNAFVMIELEPDPLSPTNVKPYPFEVSSEMAINFDLENNNINWLLCKQRISFFDDKEKKQKVQGGRYTFYGDQFSMVYHQTSLNREAANLYKPNDNSVYQTVSDKFAFWVNSYENTFGDVPGFRVGYIRNLETAGRTYVVPFDDASEHITKSIQTVSQLDITTATNVFPKEYAYVTACPGTVAADDEDGKENYCNKGRTRSGGICSMCKGTGAYVHKSGQDIVTLPLPDDKSEMIDLSKLRASFTPPIELLTYMTAINDKYEVQIHKAVYTTSILIEQKTVAKTATELDYEMRNVYGVLTDYAVKCKSVWLTIAKFCALLTKTTDKVLFIYTNPIDWKLKTLAALYEERKSINESGAPSFSKIAVDDDIAAIKLQDDTDALISYEVKKKFFPFPGKTADEIAAAMLQNYTPKRLKVLFQQFDWIFLQADLENTNFYLKNYKNQKAIIDKIVDEIITDLTPETPTFPTPPVKAPEPPEDDPNEPIN